MALSARIFARIPKIKAADAAHFATLRETTKKAAAVMGAREEASSQGTLQKKKTKR
jgi:hypothetical protein